MDPGASGQGSEEKYQGCAHGVSDPLGWLPPAPGSGSAGCSRNAGWHGMFPAGGYPQAFPRSDQDKTLPAATSNVVSQPRSMICGGKPTLP